MKNKTKTRKKQGKNKETEPPSNLPVPAAADIRGHRVRLSVLYTEKDASKVSRYEVILDFNCVYKEWMECKKCLNELKGPKYLIQ